MISQGTDGLSRGIPLKGVMTGSDMLDFVDVSKGAFERHWLLLLFVREWTDLPSLRPLSPEKWFVEGHGIIGGHLDDNNVWIPDHAKNGETYLCPPPCCCRCCA